MSAEGDSWAPFAGSDSAVGVGVASFTEIFPAFFSCFDDVAVSFRSGCVVDCDSGSRKDR